MTTDGNAENSDNTHDFMHALSFCIGSNKSLIIHITVPSSIGLVLVLLVIFALCIIRRYRKTKKNDRDQEHKPLVHRKTDSSANEVPAESQKNED